MKKIAITQRIVENSSYHETRDALDINWGVLFQELNYLPILLPSSFDFKYYFNDLKIDGVVLSGGNDLNCLSKKDIDRKRDNFEKELIKFALKKEIPIFGVCRGMQIIGDYFGCKFRKIEGHIATRHAIEINEESKFKKVLSRHGEVNSYHTYVIEDVPDEFIISARSDEHFIEAIEHKKQKIYAQMWHPERETPFKEADIVLIRKFFSQTI